MTPTPPISFDQAITGLELQRNDPVKQVQNLLGKNRTRTPEEIEKTAMDFEAVFLAQMLKPMFESEDLQWFGGGPGEDAYRALMVENFGTVLAKSGGVGIADMIRTHLLSLQEVQEQRVYPFRQISPGISPP